MTSKCFSALRDNIEQCYLNYVGKQNSVRPLFKKMIYLFAYAKSEMFLFAYN